jgi:hypothetical protein
MNATELLIGQMQLINTRIAGLAGLSRDEWLARPAPGENRVGFNAWHMVATRDWTVRPIFQQKRPIGWDGPFAGTAVARCEIPFGMTADEADAIAEAITPAEVVAYSQAVTDELVAWLRQAGDSALGARVPGAREHLGLSPRYEERGYRWELEEDPDDMCLWPAWMLLSRPCFAHCIGHLTEIGLARKAPAAG